MMQCAEEGGRLTWQPYCALAGVQQSPSADEVPLRRHNAHGCDFNVQADGLGVHVDDGVQPFHPSPQNLPGADPLVSTLICQSAYVQFLAAEL